MKKNIVVLLIALVAVSLFVGCKKEPEVNTYRVGGKGPAGGIIFYDCDADNDSTNNGAGPDGLKSSACGWRYIEAAASDLSTEYCFGYDKTFDANGEGTNHNVGTKTAIGTGKKNTEALVTKWGDKAYRWSGATATDKEAYAAKACSDYSENGIDDWYLPSKDELEEMYTVLYKAGIGNMKADEYYWSSSEVDTSEGGRAWRLSIKNDKFEDSDRDFRLYVRPIRYVSAD